nr:YgiT-type zinc finger protein [Candidatus Sigynarchaeota archaeon]
MEQAIKCPECNGDLEQSEHDVEIFGRIIGNFKCEICKVCGSTFLDDDVMQQVEEKTKEMKIFGLEKMSKVGSSGNSLIIRINKVLAEYLQLNENSNVRVYPIDKRRFIVEKI